MMNRFKVIAVAFCMIFVASVIAPTAKGQNGDMKTVVTFSEPIEIPGGKILPAGTYFFKLLNQDSGRWVVQIFDENQTKTFATLITIEDFRYHPTDKLVMTFSERPAGTPPALKEWFFEGEKFGREFVYPKTRAVELAKQSNEPVLAMPVELTPNITAPVATATDAPVVALKQAPIVAVTPTGEEVPVTDVVASAPVTAPATDTAPALAALPLPHTASSVPLIALLGLLSIGAAFCLAVLAKRFA
jgi:hypothetical protein